MVLCGACFNPELSEGEITPDDCVCEGCGGLSVCWIYPVDPRQERPTNRKERD